ncbi:MAG: phosphatidate cytidylyltransferase [Balneolaceae bacterium]
MSELSKRVLIAIPLALLVLYVTWLGSHFFLVFIAVIALITVWEIHRIMVHAGKSDYLILSIMIGCAVWSGLFFPPYVSLSLIGLILIISLGALVRPERVFSERWFSTLFTGVYAPTGFLMMVYIRNLGDGFDGFWLTMTLFLMIWGNDIFAYFGGKTFGKRALAPTISPKKTWEGFYWGFAGAAIGFLIIFYVANPYPLPIWSVIPAVVIISLFGPLGDIAASSLKRKADLKDSSSILPGHGGFFDRFDSLILSAPFLFFFYLILIG